MFKLVIQDDEGKTTVVPLIRDEITIGRKEGNTIRLTERNVSRRHARIVRQNNEVQIEDLGSYNGIRVNNARIAERVSLRVSDQVQIGDYKLYLKAEGVEQVDDARTMPIERIENPNELLATAQTPPVPVAPMQARSAMEVDGRPIANAAQVAALSAPVGYGKLVVLSSNFARRELELSRPQMIIGRTDENDLVINHRSISRNHAKITREPDTGRYTISDLQSSNGVRVNGQDYGKVELRRGDVVDLGHVRLRFVEPGEDFVFDRDAVITDVPEGGGKKGLLVALVLGVLVLGGVVAFFATRGGGDSKPNNGNGGDGSGKVVNGGGGGSQTMVETSPDAAQVAVADDAPAGGAIEPAITIDAAVTNTNTNPAGSNNPTTNPGNDEELAKCLELQAQRKWTDLQTCANGLAGTNADKARELQQKAKDEFVASAQNDKIADAVREDNLRKAADLINKMKSDSVYYKEAKKTFDDFEKKTYDDYMKRGRAAAEQKHCKDLDKLAEQAPSQAIASALKKIQCTPPDTGTVAVKNPGTGSNTTTNPPPPPPQNACSATDIQGYKDKAQADMGAGQDSAALVEFEKAYRCSSDGSLLPRMILEACKAGNAGKAKTYFAKCGAGCQGKGLEGRCLQSAKIVLP